MKIEKIRKTNQILLFALLIILALYYGSSLLIPVTFAIFFATLIFPFVHWFERRTGAGKMLSSFIGTLVIFLGVGLLMFFLIQQLGLFLKDIIESRGAILGYFEDLQEKAASVTGFSMAQQEELLEDSLTEILNLTQSYVSGFLAGAGNLLFNFLLVLIFVFLFLLNRDKMVRFLNMYQNREEEGKTEEIIIKTRKVAHKYLWGRIQVMTILALMYLVLFNVYDLRHAGLLIIFGALITIVPYIGPFVSGVIPILFLIIFGGSSAEIISFSIIITIIQLIESYVLEPVLIGSEVEQSPLFIVIAIIIGGMIWGPAGLILFVPIFSILKILFDNSKGLEPVGFLIGYERPDSKPSIFSKIRRHFKKEGDDK